MTAFLCLDIGLKRTGVALSESGVVARPLLPVLKRVALVSDVVNLVKEWNIQSVIVGMPNRIDDSPSTQAELVTGIIQEISNALARAQLTPAIVTYNEFGTTRSAKRLYPSLDDNAGAATLLLQEYLDSLV